MHEFSIPTHMPDWIKDHVARYLESDGADGHMWDSSIAGGKGMIPTLLLATTGRKSGAAQTRPLIYSKTEGGYVVIASRGGTPQHPDWYLNLVGNPDVSIKVAADAYEAKARAATGDEREALWAQMAELYPPYNLYQQRTERQIPVVVIEPIAS
ncbi:MAG: nitroreductase family deazaflavin-dependent oxidoreductase [Dehalococcoidia bacterium]